MSEFKKFCGSGKVYNNEYGRLEIISVCLDDIDEQSVTVATNGKRYAKLKIVDRRDADQFGNTLSVQNTLKEVQKKDPF